MGSTHRCGSVLWRLVEEIGSLMEWNGIRPQSGLKGTEVPYVSHLLGTCGLVLEAGGDEDEAIAGLLHDTLEDQVATFDEIAEEFGERVAGIVRECSDTEEDPKPPWQRMTGDPERTLHPNNSGTLQWGRRYREFHERAWTEVQRVLKPGAMFILNSSDHIRNGEVQPVTEWHLSTASRLGFEMIDRIEVPTPRMRNGANFSARVDHETVACSRN